MKSEEMIATRKKGPKAGFVIALVCLILAVCAAGGFFLVKSGFLDRGEEKTHTEKKTEKQEEQDKEPPRAWQNGFLAALTPTVGYEDLQGEMQGELFRGAEVSFEQMPDGSFQILLDEREYVLQEGGSVVTDPTLVVPAHTLFVRTAVNLRNEEGKLLDAFAEKGASLEIVGCDYAKEDGSVHMLRVRSGETEGFLPPWYLTETEEEANSHYDNGSYSVHASRGNRYGGGDAASLDYFPREKGAIEGNVMPAECRTLYMATWSIKNVDSYLDVAAGTGINAFVVDIADSGAIGYAADVMTGYAPTAARAAHNTVEEYKSAIEKIRAAGYYVIGRITTFNDTYFVKDHPELAIAGTDGNPVKLSGEYWPTAYNRTVWQYKVDLAVEAVKLMGFQEIQFDYVRFPDRTGSLEKAGKIDFRNTYGETKAQAIQRFLMYAADMIRENGAYVSADVFGESAYTYVTAYGQYWPAISGVVDAVSGMPYPDHFAASGNWRPWEHPYETLNNWGKNVMARQAETANPAAVRTWIQAYNAIREPYNTYGPAEISAQIRGLRDAGCTGGFITWNAASSVEKYRRLAPAFSAS